MMAVIVLKKYMEIMKILENFKSLNTFFQQGIAYIHLFFLNCNCHLYTVLVYLMCYCMHDQQGNQCIEWHSIHLQMSLIDMELVQLYFDWDNNFLWDMVYKMFDQHLRRFPMDNLKQLQTYS